MVAENGGLSSRRAGRVLGVFTDVEHWRTPDGELLAFEPYVREMRIWARLFERIVVCAPAGAGGAAGGVAPYGAENVGWTPTRYSQRQGTLGRARRLVQLGGLIGPIEELVRASDLVLLRSPSHTALVARMIAALHRRRTITKWAGYFGPVPTEHVARRIERLMVKRMSQPALVYQGDDRPHLIAFIPAFMTEAEIRRARDRSLGRVWSPPWNLLAVGRLSVEKGHDITIEALARLRERAPELAWHHCIAGDGPEAARLRRLVDERRLADRVTFAGGLPFEQVQALYARAHVLIQASRIEGYGKTIPEAWAHGVVPVAADVGHLPVVMAGEGAGVLVPPDPDRIAGALHDLLADPARMQTISERGFDRVQALSLETFAARLEAVLARQVQA